MTKTIVVCGYGPGISDAVARRFGAAGFQVALVSRTRDKVEKAAAALGEAGYPARGFVCDLGDPAAVRAMIREARSALGPITVLHWNAYAGVAGDLLTCDVEEVRRALDVGVVGAVAAVQEAHADLRAQSDAAVLVTGGGFAFYEPAVDAVIVRFRAMGLALAKSAQHKLVGILAERLHADGVHVGEVIVLGAVKGTAFDRGQAPIDPAVVAEHFFSLYRDRDRVSVRVG